MAKDVHDTVRVALASALPGDTEAARLAAADAHLTEMARQNRYQKDVWF